MSLKLIVNTPIQPTPKGHGFYQAEERSLYVQLGLSFDSNRFYSFIDSPVTKFDIDRQGHLMFIEVISPMSHWKKVDDLKLPAAIEPADIRWLDFRMKIDSPELLTNQDNSILKILFKNDAPAFNYYLADSVVLQVNNSKEAVAIYITDIVKDAAGRKIASFRRRFNGRDEPSSHSHSSTPSAATLS